MAIGLEPILRFSISIMPALPDNRLMHYSTHSTRKRELSYTTTDRALMTRIMWRNPTVGSRTLQMLFPVVHSVSWSGRHNVFANSVMHLMQDKAAAMTTCFADGSPGWIRTSDQPLRRRLLFPLSYRQIWWAVKDSNLSTLPL